MSALSARHLNVLYSLKMNSFSYKHTNLAWPWGSQLALQRPLLLSVYRAAHQSIVFHSISRWLCLYRSIAVHMLSPGTSEWVLGHWAFQTFLPSSQVESFLVAPWDASDMAMRRGIKELLLPWMSLRNWTASYAHFHCSLQEKIFPRFRIMDAFPCQVACCIVRFSPMWHWKDQLYWRIPNPP